MSALAPGSIFAGDYRIERPLGEGGMGAVYVATQLRTQKLRALKVLKPELVMDAKVRARFVDEARVGARIPSEHVVEVIDAGMETSSGTPWLAMELLDGEDLAHRVERLGPLSARDLLPLVSQLGHALAAAHAAGVVHRDLKPENLFVARTQRHDGEPTLKVLDFGIAKLLPEHRTAATVTAAMGSPLYWSPEQTRSGSQIRATSDVWSLGLVAFFLLTGRSYWRTAAAETPSIGELVVELMMDDLPRPSQRAAELGFTGTLPPRFDEWFASCVTRDASARFHDGGVACTALSAVLAGSSTSAAAPVRSHAPAALAATAPAVTPMPRTVPIASQPSVSPSDTESDERPAGVSAFPWWLVGVAAVALLGVLGLGAWLTLGRPAPPTSAVVITPTVEPVSETADAGPASAAVTLATAEPAHAHHVHGAIAPIGSLAIPTSTSTSTSTSDSPSPSDSPSDSPSPSPSPAPAPAPSDSPSPSPSPVPPPAPSPPPDPAAAAPPDPPRPHTCLEALDAAGQPWHTQMFCNGADDRCAVALLGRGLGPDQLMFCRNVDGACAEDFLRGGGPAYDLANHCAR